MQTINSGFVSALDEIRFIATGDSQTDGTVVGNMTLEAATAVPEPASIALLAIGLTGVYGAVRRRRNGGGA